MVPFLLSEILPPCCFRGVQGACSPPLLHVPPHQTLFFPSPLRCRWPRKFSLSSVSPPFFLPQSLPLCAGGSQGLSHFRPDGLSALSPSPLPPGLPSSLKLNLLQMLILSTATLRSLISKAIFISMPFLLSGFLSVNSSHIKTILHAHVLSLGGKHFLQDGLRLITAFCVQGLWNPSSHSPLDSRASLQRGRGVVGLLNVRSGQELACKCRKVLCWREQRGKDVRKETESYHLWQMAKRMPAPHSHFGPCSACGVLCTERLENT